MKKSILICLILMSSVALASDTYDVRSIFLQIQKEDTLVSLYYAQLCQEESGEELVSEQELLALEKANLVQIYTDQFSKKIESFTGNISQVTIPAHHLLILSAKDCDQATELFNQKTKLQSAHIQITPESKNTTTITKAEETRWKKFRKKWSVSLNWGVHRVFWSPIDLHIVSGDGTDLQVDNVRFVDDVSLQWFKVWDQAPEDRMRFLDEPQNSFTFSFYNHEKEIELVIGYHHHRLRLKGDSNYFEGHEYLDGTIGPGQTVSVSGTVKGEQVEGDINLNNVLSQYRISNGLNRIFVGANKVFTLKSGKLGDLRLKAGGTFDTFLAISNSVLHNDLSTVHEGVPKIGGFGATGNLTVQFVSKWEIGAHLGAGFSGYKLNKIPIHNGYIDHSFATFTTIEAGISIPLLNAKRYNRKRK